MKSIIRRVKFPEGIRLVSFTRSRDEYVANPDSATRKPIRVYRTKGGWVAKISHRGLCIQTVPKAEAADAFYVLARDYWSRVL